MSPRARSLGRHVPDCSHMDVYVSPTFLSAPRCSSAKTRLLSVPSLSPAWPGHPNAEPSKALTFSFSCSFSWGIILQLKFLGSL